MLLAELRKKRPKIQTNHQKQKRLTLSPLDEALQRQKTELEQGGYRPKPEEEDISQQQDKIQNQFQIEAMLLPQPELLQEMLQQMESRQKIQLLSKVVQHNLIRH